MMMMMMLEEDGGDDSDDGNDGNGCGGDVGDEHPWPPWSWLMNVRLVHLCVSFVIHGNVLLAIYHHLMVPSDHEISWWTLLYIANIIIRESLKCSRLSCKCLSWVTIVDDILNMAGLWPHRCHQHAQFRRIETLAGFIDTHRIHGTGLFAYMNGETWLYIFRGNVGIHIPNSMDPLG